MFIMNENNNFEIFSENIEDNFIQYIKPNFEIKREEFNQIYNIYAINNTSRNSNNVQIPINNQIEEYILDVILLDESKKKEKNDDKIKNRKS